MAASIQKHTRTATERDGKFGFWGLSRFKSGWHVLHPFQKNTSRDKYCIKYNTLDIIN